MGLKGSRYATLNQVIYNTTTYNSLEIGTDDVGSNQWWRRLDDWAHVIRADFQTVISRNKNSTNPFLHYWKNVKNYKYEEFQAAPGMFSYQNHRGLNRPILRPLWLMTSAAADVISVLSVVFPNK